MKTRLHRGLFIVPRRAISTGGRYYVVRFHYGNETFDSVREARQYIDFIRTMQANRRLMRGQS